VDLVAHSQPVTCLAVSVDETVVVSASLDGSISFYMVSAKGVSARSSCRR
jgi:WD40 repeat protein